MKHLTSASGTRLIILALGIGSLAVLALMFWAGSTASASDTGAPVEVGAVAPPPRERAISSLPSSYSGISCTVSYTTTRDSLWPNGTDFGNAVRLQSSQYSDLSLVGTVNVPNPNNPVLAPVFDEYFYLDASDVQIGAFYTVTASSNLAGNYSLGIIVYDQSQTNVVKSDTGGKSSVSITLVPTATGRYYFRVVQAQFQSCTGDTYDLSYRTSSPAPGTVPDSYEPNDTSATAKSLSQNNVTGLSLCNSSFCPDPVGAPSGDQDWYIVAATLRGYSYTVSAAADSAYPTLQMEIIDPNGQSIGNLLGSAPSITWIANVIGDYRIHIQRAPGSPTNGTYHLSISYSTPPSSGAPDIYDSSSPFNENPANAGLLSQSSLTALTLYNATLYPTSPGSDQDWYYFYGLQGYQYTVSAAPDGTYPYLSMRITNTAGFDQSPPTGSPSYTWVASSSGTFYIHIQRADASSPTNGTYHLNWSTNAPTVTPTPTPGTGTPTDTPVPGLDAFEPNWDFDHAAGIGLNVKYTSINFVPLPGQSVNNDFFKVRVKTGMLVTCETLDLTAGTDTNMILYDDNRQGLAGNDDVDKTRGELRSRVTVSINYDGFLYILVGQGYAVPNSQAAQYTYSLQCTVGAGQVTATPTPPPGATAAPPAPVSTPTPPIPTEPPPSATSPATPMPPISVRALPTPTPTGPVQQMVTADLQVYYDANDNGVADPGEGVVGLPARVYDATTGALLAQGFTNVTGHAVFSVPAAGSVRVVVPYLGFEAMVPPSGATIPVLISPRELPEQIP